ncbi:MAG: 4Fe-4S binding protein [Thermoguttaceae bacterium]
MAKQARGSSRRRPGHSRARRWRIWVQAAFLLAWLDPLMLRVHTVCSPVFHCYSCPLATFACPIGVLANFSALGQIPYLAIGTLLVVGASVGSLVCGWACPFGFLQDLFGRIPTHKFMLPVWLGYCRYAVLGGLVLWIPYVYGEGHPLFFCSVCPAGAAEGALPHVAGLALAGQAIDWPGATKIVILLVFVGLALCTWRPWCTLFCPLGAVYSLCNRFSLVFVRLAPEACTECDLCRDLCHLRGPSERRAGPGRCIRCLECTGCGAIGIGTALGPRRKTPVAGAGS